MANADVLDFYRGHGPITDPGDHGYLFDDVPGYDSWGGPLVSEPDNPPASQFRYLDRAETTPAEARFLDQLAELTTDPDRQLAELRRRYAESTWGRGVLDRLATAPPRRAPAKGSGRCWAAG